MRKKRQDPHRARYTLEFKLEAIRLVKAGQSRTGSVGDGAGVGHAQADPESLDSAGGER